MAQGVVKVYDPTTGVGVIVNDSDRSEVMLRPGSLQGSVFRTLRQGQRIVYQVEVADGQNFAHSIGFGSDGH
jgi:CspA family cold shock protein